MMRLHPANIPIWPEGASKAAFEMDLLYLVIVGLTVFFCAIVFGLVIYFVAKYHAGSKADRSNPAFHNMTLELAWSLIPLALGLFVFGWAAKLFVEMQAPIQSENALNIYVVGKQWMWQMQHPTGQRENNELHIPVGRPVKLTMISQDVIHSFYVPAFRTKADVVPGRYRTLWFEPTKVGKYHLFCAEYCGTKHSEMVGWVYVLSPEDYEKWLENNRWGMGDKGVTVAQAGQALYEQLQCASCHAPEQRIGPPLTGLYGSTRTLSDGRRVVADYDYLRQAILDPQAVTVSGYEAIMPPYRGQLTEQEVIQLIEFIKTLSAPQTPAVAEAEQSDDLGGNG